jgi:hypothetical protein
MTSDLLAMTVRDMAFLIDQLNKDCSPLQFVRELTKNAIEAIQNLDEPKGEIRWDLDWNRYMVTDGAIAKLCLIDTGIGMTGEEMVTYINQLSSSIHKQSSTGNFGVGAKISAAPLNPEGLVYLSWKDGKGYMIQLYRDSKVNKYGLLRFEREYWAYIGDDIKPDPIKENGTMVILLGRSKEEDTMTAPPKTTMPKKWVLRYLNSRFYRFPKGIKVKAREGWELERGDKHNFLRTVTGQGPWLDDNNIGHGTVRLENERTNVHWWIIDGRTDLNSGHYTPGGHMAMLFQNELYAMVHGNAGYARLQSFGVVFGCERVVIYIEPDSSDKQTVSANTARTNLMIDGGAVDWSTYASAFRDKMPDELVEYQDQIGLRSDHTDHRKAIRERLKAVRELFRFGRYKPSKDGKYTVLPPSPNTGGEPDQAGPSGGATSTGGGGGGGGKQGDIYSLFAETVGDPAVLINIPNEPEVVWISMDDGTRALGDMDDRAARYLPEQNKLIVNGDFRVFTDMRERWEKRYEHVPGAKTTVNHVVREWFTQQLMETIMSALALKHGGKWSTQETELLWDEASLTAAVLPRYHIDVNIKRALGQKLGKLPHAA